jgi:hypothetical protein
MSALLIQISTISIHKLKAITKKAITKKWAGTLYRRIRKMIKIHDA